MDDVAGPGHGGACAHEFLAPIWMPKCVEKLEGFVKGKKIDRRVKGNRYGNPSIDYM